MLKYRVVHKNIILFILALAQFMVVLDVSIINVALPAIFKGLHFSAASDLQWVVTAYTLVFGGFLLLGGRAADLFGRKRIFMLGVILFSIASLVCGLSANSLMIEITRGVQGLAAAFMSPAALSIVLTIFQEGKERNKALSVWGAVAAGGAAVGVLLGGILTQYLNWRWNFFVNVPVGIGVLIATMRYVPESKANLDHKNLDLTGAVLVTSGLMLLVYGITKAPTYGWTDHRTLLFLGWSLVLLLAFIRNEWASKHPLMPLSIFKIRNLSAANLTQLPVMAALFSMFFFLSLYVQTVLGYSPVKSGLSFLPVTFIIALVSIVMSRVITKIGYKKPLVIGPVLLAIGLALLAQVRVGGAYWQDVFPGLAVMAVGLGMVFISITIAATNGVPQNESGLASGLLNTSQQIGGALGLAILSGVASSTTLHYIANHPNTAQLAAKSQVAGYQNAFYVGMGFAIVSFILALLLIKERKGEQISLDAAMAAGA